MLCLFSYRNVLPHFCLQFQFTEESVRERVQAREYENEPSNSQWTMSSVGKQRKCQLVA